MIVVVTGEYIHARGQRVGLYVELGDGRWYKIEHLDHRRLVFTLSRVPRVVQWWYEEVVGRWRVRKWWRS